MGVTPIPEDPLFEELQELDIYEEEGVENLMDEDGISDAEYGFMTGFLAS
ncbi:hypothetical protein GF343_00500 [Candidatus Woesearchaeota archaeon]|nr:hypothetical protein [Candidatus Woesearchaeota archaeon]